MFIFRLHDKTWMFNYLHEEIEMKLSEDSDVNDEGVTVDGFQYTQAFTAILQGREAENVLIVEEEEFEETYVDENGEKITETVKHPGFIMKKKSRGYEEGIEDAKNFIADESYVENLPWVSEYDPRLFDIDYE